MELQVRLRQIFFFSFFLLTVLEHSYSARILTISKPDRHDVAASARWLVSQNIWGVLSTLSIEHQGAPFGNVVSFSDGLPGKGNGIPFFYLTSLDPTTRNALKDARASFTVSESPIGTCNRDPMDPTCSKLTLTGKLLQLDEGSEEEEVAKKALFTKHPEMMDWPKGHDFRVFKLEIINIFLINWYGGAKSISVDEYLRSKSIDQSRFLFMT
uniref:Protein CREG2 n=1 Tax=Noccaea caerulescens TaxID=107243 RepID=A0A1J3HXD5_NOCCA